MQTSGSLEPLTVSLNQGGEDISQTHEDTPQPAMIPAQSAEQLASKLPRRPTMAMQLFAAWVGSWLSAWLGHVETLRGAAYSHQIGDCATLLLSTARN